MHAIAFPRLLTLSYGASTAYPKYFIVHTFRYVDSETNVDYILNSA